jgi:hypothetical protein
MFGVLVLLATPLIWADGPIVDAAPAGTSLKHFTQVDEGIFAGSKPSKDADFEFLRSKGVKYILQAHFLPAMTGRERSQAAKYGLEFLSIPMNASPIAPSAKHVNAALRIMRTRQPVYIHCVLGRDRTGLLTACTRFILRGSRRMLPFE